MKPLTEDDFYIVKEDMPDLYQGAIVINGSLGYDIGGSKARTEAKKLVKQILKWKEDSEELQKAPTYRQFWIDYPKYAKIVERLKKEIQSMSVSSQDYHSYEVGDLLEEILEGEK